MENEKIIYTIGHSTLTNEEFIKLLKGNKIQTLVDVRTVPYSKWTPQFNRQNLSFDLRLQGIKYEWRGNNLGGKGINVNFEGSIDELAERCQNEIIVLMCSEADYKKCHRYQLISPNLEKLGVKVKHITSKGNLIVDKQIIRQVMSLF